MNSSLTCPECQKPLSIKKETRPGAKVRCPACQHVFHLISLSMQGNHANITTPPTLPPLPEEPQEAQGFDRLDAGEKLADGVSDFTAGFRKTQLPATPSTVNADTVSYVERRPRTQAPAMLPPDYDYVEELGRGGMGVVYKARHKKLDRVVAVKMILAGAHASAHELERFALEARAVARLQHPGIVQIYEIGEHLGLPYFTLEYCDGGTLSKIIDNTPQDPYHSAAIVESLAEAMHAAHKKNVMHRDLKPANVLLVRRKPEQQNDKGKDAPDSVKLGDLLPKITDFGLAKKLDDAGQTASGAIMGTPSYMAPEQAAGQTKEIGPLADVYGLGAILYELMTGRPPFRAATKLDTLLQVVSNEPAPPSQLNPSTPRDLEVICLKCLAKEKHKRYASALELAEDLRRFQRHEPIKARPVGRLERSWRWCRRNPVIAGLIGAVAATLMIGTTVAWLFAMEAQQQAQIARKEKDDSNIARTRAETLLYAAQLSSALRELEADKPEQAELWLEKCRWDFRNWEHDFLYTSIQRKASSTGKGKENTAADVEILTPKQKNGAPLSFLGFHPDCKRAFLWEGGVLDGGQSLHEWNLESGEIVNTARLVPGEQLVQNADAGRAVTLAGPDLFVTDLVTGKILLKTRARALSPDQSLIADVIESPIAEVQFEGKMPRIPPPPVRRIRIIDAKSGAELVQGAGTLVSGPVFSRDSSVMTWYEQSRELKIWTRETNRLQSLVLDCKLPPKILFGPTADVFWTFTDGLLQCWNTEGLKRGVSFGPTRGQNAMISPDGSLIALIVGKNVQVFDTGTGKESNLKGNDDDVLSFAFSPDNKRLVSGGRDKTIRVWDLASGLELTVLKHHPAEIDHVSFTSDGRFLVSRGNDRSFRAWNASRKPEVLTLRLHDFPIKALAFSPDGGRCISAAGAEFKIWDVKTGQQLEHFIDDHPTEIVSAPKGEGWLWFGSSTLKRRTDKNRTVPLSGSVTFGFGIALSPDGSRYASKSAHDLAHIWNTRSGKETVSFSLRPSGSINPDASSSEGAFSLDGKILALVRGNGIQIVDANSGKEIWYQANAHPFPICSIAFAQNGESFVSADIQGSIRIWQVKEGQPVQEMTGQNRQAIAINPDGSVLAAGNRDNGTLTFWNLREGTKYEQPKAHRESVTCLAFTPDGRYLVSGGEDKTIKLWRINSKQ